MMDTENKGVENKEWIQLYGLSKQALETEIIRLSVNKKYTSHKAALNILSLENRGLIQLPIENANVLVGASFDTLVDILRSPDTYDKNTLVVATYELERSGQIVEDKLNFIKQVENSSKIDVADVGGAIGLSLMSIILIIISVLVGIWFYMYVIGATTLRTILKGLFS